MLAVITVVLFLSAVSHGCMFSNPRMMSDLQMMNAFDIMVYGQYMETTLIDGRSHHSEGRFQVECVLREDNPNLPIPSTVILQDPLPVQSCDMTQVVDGEKYILGMSRDNTTGQFYIHRFGREFPAQNAALRANPENMNQAAGLCSVAEIRMPEGTALTQSEGCLEMTKTYNTLRRRGICANVLPPSDSDLDLQREARPAETLRDRSGRFLGIYGGRPEAVRNIRRRRPFIEP